MMSQIVNLNDSISEQRFIDININDNEDQQLESPKTKTRSTHGSDNSIKSIFNFINNENKRTPLKKLNSELTPKTCAPITKKSPLTSSLSVPPTNLPKPIPNDFQMKLADIVINSSECSEDDEDEEDLMNLNDEKLLELNRNVKTLKRNSYVASSSLISLKENECDKDNMSDIYSPSHGPHSTPMRHASSSTFIESHDTNDELHGTTSSLVSDSDTTLSLTECSDSSHNKSGGGNLELREMLSRNDSIVDGLLGDIYDRFNISLKENFNESDAFTDLTVSSYNFTESKSWHIDSDMTESNAKCNYGKGYVGMKSSLKKLDLKSLSSLVNELTLKSNQTSTKLIKQLRQKDKLLLKLDKNSDILTSILQARSLKRRIDTQMKFTIDPMPGEAGFIQWKDAMKALVRLPGGVPKEFRKSVWLNLSKQYITEINLDWHKVRRAAFNDRSNPDDHELGIQIVKDLHRTGCSSFSGSDNEQDRALLKRVLLAFARYNKTVGYCQGFNIIVAQILEIVDKKEEDALMCMIYLIDHILPEGYFTNSMHTLAIDMAVFRELLKQRLPKLCQHLNALQFNALTESSSPLSLFYGKKSKARKDKLAENSNNNLSASYEPPLTNVFTMQWYLTLFATCLPKSVLLRVWDCLFLEGAEILFRTSIAIWDKLSVSVMKATSADSFYSMMSVLTVKLFEKDVINENDLMNKIYSYGPFPLSGLEELREKLTFNITPFQQASSLQSAERGSKAKRKQDQGLSHLKLNTAGDSNNEDVLIGDLNPGSPGANSDNLDLALRTKMKEDGDKSKRRYFYDEENDDDEVEDLAQMISCFALLMPNRQISSSSASNMPSPSSTTNDIMLHAAAAASAYGSKLVTTKNKKDRKSTSKDSSSEQQQQQKLSDDVSSVTPGAFSYIAQMYNPKPLGDHLTSDLNELKKQYKKLKERQQQAHIIVQAASDQHRRSLLQKNNSSPPLPKRMDKLSVTSPGMIFGPIDSPKKKLIDSFEPSRTIKPSVPPIDSTTPVVNHLLIKPSDLQCNTVKQAITLVNSSSAETSSYADSYIDIEKNIKSLNHECSNLEKLQSHQKKEDAKMKPYYSDDSEDDEDEATDEDLDETNKSGVFGDKEKGFGCQEPAIKDLDLVKSNLIQFGDGFREPKSRSDSSSSSCDDCFDKESIVSKPEVPGPSHEQLKKKLSNESKLVMKHLAREEKRNMNAFNPFPMRQINSNVAKNGMRLGLYK